MSYFDHELFRPLIISTIQVHTIGRYICHRRRRRRTQLIIEHTPLVIKVILGVRNSVRVSAFSKQICLQEK